MKKFLLFAVTGVILFGISGTVSYFLSRPAVHGEEPTSAAAGGGEEEAAPGKAELPAADKGHGERGGSLAEQPRAVRPTYVQGSDEAVALANRLKARESVLKEREDQLNARQKHLELIIKDIKAERDAIDQMRNQLKEDLRLVEEKTAKLEEERQKLQDQRDRAREDMKDIEKNRFDIEKDQFANVKRMAEYLNKTAADSAAKILKEMVEKGNLETAVQILVQMEPKQVSKVLPEMPESLASQMMEKMKWYKKPTPPAPGGAPTIPLPVAPQPSEGPAR